ncbi:MAG TPA: nucleoside hydrolase [Bacilli bacterium]|nr:nucleoside hydrolase [Bacilli bacterium]
MKKIPVILDTDIGDDIDDAFALALIHALEAIELVGVTTVYRDTLARAKMVARYFDAVDELFVPVRMGETYPYKEPLKTLPNEPDTTGKPCSYDQGCDHYVIDHESAIDFIIRKAHAYQGELVLVPIGALTNIARAIEKDPSIKPLIKKIVMMSGWFTNHEPEWNVIVDPEAADIVYSSGIPIDAIGLDVTLKCTFEQDLLDELFARTDKKGMLLSHWFKMWQQSTKFAKSVMHDPLAVTTLVSDVCVFKPLRVKVNLTNKRGALDILPIDSNDGSIINAALDVDRDRFYQIIRKYVFN